MDLSVLISSRAVVKLIMTDSSLMNKKVTAVPFRNRCYNFIPSERGDNSLEMVVPSAQLKKIATRFVQRFLLRIFLKERSFIILTEAWKKYQKHRIILQL